MTDKIWQKHLNPWSVLICFICLPLTSAAIWSSEWLEWWSLILIGSTFFWAWYNPKKVEGEYMPIFWQQSRD